MHGSPAIIRLCHYIVYFNHFNHNYIGVATQRVGGLQPPVKDGNTLIEQSVTQINEAHRIIDKYEANKDSETLQAQQTTESSEECPFQKISIIIVILSKHAYRNCQV